VLLQQPQAHQLRAYVLQGVQLSRHLRVFSSIYLSPQ
jgi:hypothetical protein